MLTVLSIIFPVFAVMGLAYVVVLKGLFDQAEIRTLGKYVLNIAFPAMLFNTVATRDLSDVFNLPYLAAYALIGLITGAIALVVLSAQGEGRARQAVGWIGVNSPNSAFIGFPLLSFISPEIAGTVLAMNFLVENFLLVPIGLVLLESAKGSQTSPLRLLGRTVLAVMKRPMVIALWLGLFAVLAGLHPPQALQRLLDFVGASASAVALFCVGGALVGLPLRGNRGLAGQITVGKLIVHPLVAIAVLSIPVLALAPALQVAMILSAALPMLSLYTVLVQGTGEEGVASLAMLWANIGSVVTVTALLWWLQTAA